VLIPYSQNTNFVARAETLSEIKRQFGPDQRGDSTQLRRRVSLCGLGGTSPDISVFWVHASNIDRFRQSYASIAEKCNIPGHDDPKANMLLLVSNWLEQQTMMRWLMVIDNADDMDIFCPNQLQQDGPGESSQTTAALTSGNLARYIPDCNHGSVLITTRDKKAGVRLCQGLRPIEVKKMTDDEAYQLLQLIISTQQISMDQTVRLLSKLEHLPLALAQAASFIQENDISIDDYVQLLDQSDSAFVDQLSESFETVGRDSETPHAVTATWIISFEQIRRKEAFVSDILSFLSFFHFQAIPRVFVEHYYYQQRCQEQSKGDSPATAVLVTEPTLGTLKAFSFISEGENKGLTMHRLVQLVTQKWVINESQVAKFAEFAMKTMSAYYPPVDFSNREICMSYLPHANSVLEKTTLGLNNDTDIATAALLNKMSKYFHFKGQWKEAENLTAHATKIYKRTIGEEHPRTLICMTNLSSTYSRQGRWNEAEDLQMHLRDICIRELGDEHPTTLQLLLGLSNTYRRQSRWRESEGLAVRVLKTCKKLVGHDHYMTFTLLGNSSLALAGLGRMGEAIALRAECVAGLEKTLGRDDPDTKLFAEILERWRESVEDSSEQVR
ncbi:hypothetical protein TRIATDRAFT_189067, partial [Trichoderma atroviride IMI 206040]